MAGRLADKVALISGGARGMGASHAEAMIAEGAQVVIADLLDDEGAATAERLGDAARYVHLDVTSPEDWAAAVAATVDTFGKLNVLVNNAGIINVGTVEDYDLNDWHRIIDINLTGVFLGMRASVKALREAGGGSNSARWTTPWCTCPGVRRGGCGAAHRQPALPCWSATSPVPTRISTSPRPRRARRGAAVGAGTAAGADRRAAHPHLGQGRPQCAAVAPARRRRRRARTGRHHGLAGRPVARHPRRLGRRARGRFLRPRRRIAGGGTVGGRAAPAPPRGDRRAALRPSPPRLAGRVPRRTQTRRRGRPAARHPHPPAGAGRPGAGRGAVVDPVRHAVGDLAGHRQQPCRALASAAVADPGELVGGRRRVRAVRHPGRQDGHSRARRPRAAGEPGAGHLPARRSRAPERVDRRAAGRGLRCRKPVRCTVVGVLRPGAGQ
ncbi:SDR family NAD(P)-dependent oxidoreductase [Mycolicibacterium insubricum]|nr:SDR family NAD(P)-dependent oxidoreductase [Mycolicibacterium insubricum]